MVPSNGTPTRVEVKLMIKEEIAEYDKGNSARHLQNTRKMDHIMLAILGTLLTAAASLVVAITNHLMAK
jgi:hypothetical protein